MSVLSGTGEAGGALARRARCSLRVVRRVVPVLPRSIAVCPSSSSPPAFRRVAPSPSPRSRAPPSCSARNRAASLSVLSIRSRVLKLELQAQPTRSLRGWHLQKGVARLAGACASRPGARAGGAWRGGPSRAAATARRSWSSCLCSKRSCARWTRPRRACLGSTGGAPFSAHSFTGAMKSSSSPWSLGEPRVAPGFARRRSTRRPRGRSSPTMARRGTSW